LYPAHVAIIMDGNGRWAKKFGLPRLAGHKAGVKRIHKIVELSIAYNIKYLTLYAFSSENWSRPESEINDLMYLLSTFLNKDAKSLLEKNIKLKVIGRRDRLKKDIIERIECLEEQSIANSGLTLIIALDYSGREDIRSAIINIYKKASQENIDIDNITLTDIENNLMTKGVPDPDLIIRTSGEYRVSNFLLWQSAYSEYEFVKCNWPDFNKKQYINALNNYKTRERRFGKLNE
jgi:undecaprenyl diphosphate synthase